MWSPILIRHCLVCSSCSLSERPFSGLSSCFNAALTGLILSLHCKMQETYLYICLYINLKKIRTRPHPLLWYLYRQDSIVTSKTKHKTLLTGWEEHTEEYHNQCVNICGEKSKKLFLENREVTMPHSWRVQGREFHC